MAAHFGWKGRCRDSGGEHDLFSAFPDERMAGSWRAPTPPAARERSAPIPWKVTVVHVLFIAWTVLVSHHAPLVILGLLFFLAFVEAAARHQAASDLRSPLLVGFFLGRARDSWRVPSSGG